MKTHRGHKAQTPHPSCPRLLCQHLRSMGAKCRGNGLSKEPVGPTPVTGGSEPLPAVARSLLTAVALGGDSACTVGLTQRTFPMAGTQESLPPCPFKSLHPDSICCPRLSFCSPALTCHLQSPALPSWLPPSPASDPRALGEGWQGWKFPVLPPPFSLATQLGLGAAQAHACCQGARQDEGASRPGTTLFYPFPPAG